MLDAMTGEVRWAQTYERPMDDVFAIEAEIAEAVARVLQMTLAPPVSRGLIRSAPNMDAYLLYLRGRHAWNRMSADGYWTAVEILDRVTSMFPSYATAYAGLADAYSYLAVWGLARPCEVFPKALRAAQHALRLDPSLPHAYSSLAAATAFYQRRWDEGTAHARTAIELEPSYSFGQHVYGSCLLARGKMDEARECFQQAIDLAPPFRPGESFARMVALFCTPVRHGGTMASICLGPRSRAGANTLCARISLYEPAPLQSRSRAGGALPDRPA